MTEMLCMVVIIAFGGVIIAMLTAIDRRLDSIDNLIGLIAEDVGVWDDPDPDPDDGLPIEESNVVSLEGKRAA